MAAGGRGGLAEDVVPYVRDRILRGEMRPGQKVDQEAIATALGVSRSPIREALIVLGKEGLLDLTPRRGAFVARLTPADVIDHYELFGLVSGRAAAQAADSLTEVEVEELRRVHAAFSDATELDHSKLNDEFHRRINRAAPRRTRWLLKHLGRSIPAGFYEATPRWQETAVVGHDALMKAILARDAEAARKAMEDHLHEAGVAAVRALTERGFWEEEH